MLMINQQLDQLAAACVDFTTHWMLSTPLYAPHLHLLPGDGSAVVVPSTVVDHDDGAADGPKIDATATLARTQGGSWHYWFIT